MRHTCANSQMPPREQPHPLRARVRRACSCGHACRRGLASTLQLTPVAHTWLGVFAVWQSCADITVCKEGSPCTVPPPVNASSYN